MKQIINTIYLLLLANTVLCAQSSIDFRPKVLNKELKKITGVNDIELAELHLTKAQTNNLHMGKFFTIDDQHVSSDVKYVYVGRANTCRMGGCSIASNNDKQSGHEFFDYYILYTAAAAIKTVKLYNYQASHGQEVTADSWLKQFRDYDGKQQLVAGKNFDAISGATVSVVATAAEIEHTTKLLLTIIGIK